MDRTAVPWPAVVLLAAGSICYFTFTFAWFTLPAYLAPILAAFGVSNALAGLLAGAVPFVYIPLGLVSGVLIDRVGSRWGIGLGVATVGVAQLLRSVSTDVGVLLGGTLLLGVGGTGVTFGLPKLASDLFDPDRVGSASSVFLVCASLGTAAAYSVGRGVLGPLLGGWRPVFVLSGGVAVAAGLGWLVLATVVDRRGRTRGDPADALTLAGFRRDATTVVANRSVRLLVVIGTMVLLVLHGLQGWLVAILELDGVDPVTATTVASLFVGGQIVGTILLPVAADRWRTKRGMVALGGGLACVGALALVGVDGPVAASVAAIGVGTGVGGLMPIIVSVPTELDGIGPDLTATAVGIVFAVGEVGGFGGPVVIGALRDLTGSFVPGLVVLAAGGLVIVAAALALDDVDEDRDGPSSDSPSGGAAERVGSGDGAPGLPD